MARIHKNLIVVGDRLLIKPRAGEERTGAGLYLPATAVSSQEVLSGRVVKVGPGIPVADPGDDEAWKPKSEGRFVPLQAREGDIALFLKKAAVEIRFGDEPFLVVPNSAVLVLEREEIDLSDELGDLEGHVPGDED